MHILIRTDSSINIGTGHVMRCLTLADLLREANAKISFISRPFPGNICKLIEQKGYNIDYLPHLDKLINLDHSSKIEYEEFEDIDLKQTIDILIGKSQIVDCLIVDHYLLDIIWETGIRQYVKKIFVIDDLANRVHDCDLLLDQNYYDDLSIRYDNLIPKHCKKFLGPQFTLLRKEFEIAKETLKERDGLVRRILVFFGGTDPTNETIKTLMAIQQLDCTNLYIDVVVGKTNLHQKKIEELCSVIPNTNYYCQVDNMAELMAQADLSIGAGGITTWERCYLGLPSLTIIVASNQVEVNKAVALAGATWNMGLSTDITIEHLSKTLTKAINNPKMLKQMSKNAIKLMGSVFVNQNSIIHSIIEGK